MRKHFEYSSSPFNLQVIQLPPHPPAPSSCTVQAPLHHVQHLGRSLGPRVHRALHVVLPQLVLVPVVRIHHHLALGVPPEHHVGPEHAAQLAQEGRGVAEEQLGRDVDHHHQLAHRQLLRHVVGAVQAVPLALGVVAALVTVAVGIVVLTVLVIQRAGGGGGHRLGVL